MDKNYYKILEVDKSASKEVIEKVYKILVKKSHPDLQDESNKQFYENKLKAINEAYDILSDPIKRNQYDSELKAEELRKVEKLNNNTISDKEFEALFNENLQLKNTIRQLEEFQSQESKNNEDLSFYNDFTNQKYINQNKQKIKNYSNFNNNFNYSQYNHQINDAINESINKAYHDAYIQDLKNRGYKIRYKKTLKDYIRNFIALVITIFILFLVFQIPFVKNYFINLYNTNVVIQSIVDFITNLFH